MTSSRPKRPTRKKTYSSRRVRCIVTGFDAFGEDMENPTQLLAEGFPDSLSLGKHGQVQVERAVFETCCLKSVAGLDEILARGKGERLALLMTGLAAVRTKISLEFVALNLRDYRIEDNAGHRHGRELLFEGEPNALFNDLPLESLQKDLTKRGYPCEVSYHAGTFVCNEIYYHALRLAGGDSSLKAVLFVHLPLPEKLAESIKSKDNPNRQKILARHNLRSKKSRLACMSEAMAVITRFLAMEAGK
ncbi:MAG: pyroglutamyl-peptidase I [Cyanobacteria bacterium HKST-UBA02]|nr:pyroglutamyl-peptidase I [Cyanobacteria bacterium HKST-UBA02]